MKNLLERVIKSILLWRRSRGKREYYTIQCTPPFRSTVTFTATNVTLDVPATMHDKHWFFGGFIVAFFLIVIPFITDALRYPVWVVVLATLGGSVTCGVLAVVCYRLLFKRRRGYVVNLSTRRVMIDPKIRTVFREDTEIVKLSALVLPAKFVRQKWGNKLWTGACVYVHPPNVHYGLVVACVRDLDEAVAYAQSLKDQKLVGTIVQKPEITAVLWEAA